jgi:hypothetical protein
VTPFIQDALALLAEQRHDQPTDHAKGPDGGELGLVYDPRCRDCRGVTMQPPPGTKEARP